MKNINILKLNFKFFFCSVVMLFIFVNIFMDNFDKETNNIAGMCILLISGYLVCAYRHNIMLFTIYFALLFFNYSIVVPVYFQTSNVFLYQNIQNEVVYGTGIYVLLLFMVLLLLFKKNKIEEDDRSTLELFKTNTNKNILIVTLISFVLILIVGGLLLDINIFGYSINALYEYSILFFILGYFYSGENKYWKVILSLILLLYTFLTFIDGDRASVLQMLIATFLLLFHDKVTYKKLMPFMILGILLMTWLGLYGDNSDIIRLPLSEIINIMKKRSFSLDTAYAAYYSSLTFVIVKNLVSLPTRLTLFSRFILSLIFGGSVVGDFSLPEYTKQYVFHYGGGILPMYFYFYLGWLGILVPASIVSFFSNKIQNIKKSSSSYTKLLAIYIVSTVPRWYLYSPTSLIRGVMLFSVVYYVFYLINKNFTIQNKI